MISARYYSQLFWLIKRTLPPVLMLAGTISALGSNNPVITSPLTATGTIGVAFTYQITADQAITKWGAAPLSAGITVNTTTGLMSGTPTTPGGTSVTISATNNHGTGSAPLFITIVAPSFVGLRLPDFLMAAGTPNNPRLMLQMGANGATTPANRFNATLEVNAGDAVTPLWVPYNHFVGINDSASWMTDAPLPVRDSAALTGAPQAFGTGQLTLSPPAVYMKADPRATRFGIVQMDTVLTTAKSRIMLPLWPSPTDYPTVTTVPNGFGGAVATTWPGPVEHAPNRFSGAAYYPATLCINSSTTDARDNATTTYADNDGVTRPADAIYPGAAATTGSSTPYYTTSTSYHPIMLNRPFRNVAELGYAFRDLPWKTLDFFTDKSADAGLLDIFTISDGPAMVAGSVNLNSTLGTDLQPVLAGTILDEINSTTVNKTGAGATDAPVLAANIVNATNPIVNLAATPMQNKAQLLSRAGLPTTILPTASNDNQAVKARREVVPRAMTSVSQTRVWNVVIDVVAQSGHYKPNAQSLQNDFIAEGEQHYWVHVAIDRFTGQVLDKQIEVVNE